MPFNNAQIKRCDLAAFQLWIYNVDGESDINSRARVSGGGKKKKGESTLIQTSTCLHTAMHCGIRPADAVVSLLEVFCPITAELYVSVKLYQYLHGLSFNDSEMKDGKR